MFIYLRLTSSYASASKRRIIFSKSKDSVLNNLRARALRDLDLHATRRTRNNLGLSSAPRFTWKGRDVIKIKGSTDSLSLSLSLSFSLGFPPIKFWLRNRTVKGEGRRRDQRWAIGQDFPRQPDSTPVKTLSGKITIHRLHGCDAWRRQTSLGRKVSAGCSATLRSSSPPRTGNNDKRYERGVVNIACSPANMFLSIAGTQGPEGMPPPPTSRQWRANFPPFPPITFVETSSRRSINNQFSMTKKRSRVSWTANGYPSGIPALSCRPTCGCFFVVFAGSRGPGKKITNGTNRAFSVAGKLFSVHGFWPPRPLRIGRTCPRKSKLSHLKTVPSPTGIIRTRRTYIYVAWSPLSLSLSFNRSFKIERILISVSFLHWFWSSWRNAACRDQLFVILINLAAICSCSINFKSVQNIIPTTTVLYLVG